MYLTSRWVGADPWRRNRRTKGWAGLGGHGGLLAALLGWGLTLSLPWECLAWLWSDPLGSCLVRSDPQGCLAAAIGRLADLRRHLLTTLFTVLLLYNSSGISLHLLKQARKHLREIIIDESIPLPLPYERKYILFTFNYKQGKDDKITLKLNAPSLLICGHPFN